MTNPPFTLSRPLAPAAAAPPAAPARPAGGVDLLLLAALLAVAGMMVRAIWFTPI